MNFRIQEESPDVLSEYGQVPIALEVKSRFRVELIDNGLGGIQGSVAVSDAGGQKQHRFYTEDNQI